MEIMENDKTVYVGKNEYPYGRMIMSHMASPDLESLHKMAHSIGVSRKYFQDTKHHPHYDICKQMKAKAIQLGAKEVSDRDVIRKCYPELRDFMDGK